MANPTLVQTALTASAGGALQNIADLQVEAIRTLVKTYCSGVGQVLKGIRPVGDETTPIPCFMVQCLKTSPKLYSLQKWETWNTHQCAFYIGDNNPESCAQKTSDVGLILRKLFSNNALNDISGGSPTFNFKLYQPNWIQSEMSQIQYSPLFKFWKDNGPTYACAGMFTLKTSTTEVI